MPTIPLNTDVPYRSSSGRVYTLSNRGGVMSCSCPAWRNQHEHPSARTCKHLRSYIGDVEERNRLARARGNFLTTPAYQAPSPVRQPVPYQPVTYPAQSKRSQPAPPKPTLPAVPAPNLWNKLLADDIIEDDEPAPPPPPVVKAPPPVVPTTTVEATTGDEFAVLLAQTWDGAQDPTGYFMSEKLDGVRAYWDGKVFRSRLNNVFAVPDSIVEMMPKDMHLDGEFWIGRGRFQETSGLVRRQDKNEQDWSRIQFRAFDIPSAQREPFSKRYDMLRAVTTKYPMVKLVTHEVCRGVAHLRSYLAEIEQQGGEGVMLRQPQSFYERTRSSSLLKVKNFYDAEAIVVGHTAGKGKHSGRVGALECRSLRFFNGKVALNEGVEFKVGTGLSDNDRLRPPTVGSTITFRFQELTRDGVPRFPSFVGRRDYE